TCTIAVEDVIEKHYQEQLDVLQKMDDPKYEGLKNTIERFRAEELEHHETATQHGGNEHPLSKPVYALVSGITKCAIFLSKRI
ncbi:MAG: demethoxyubiquinone hydroxylase family protein, partial [Alphaproteobacteria bacterium]|nr:demethoxyubiquinone hydroxylase family protein [Alphaproteobacteria bacterium]